MTVQCPEYPKCQDRRIADAEWKGEVRATLLNMKNDIGEIKKRVIKDDADIRKLYYKAGGLAVGLAFITEMIFKLWK